MGPRNGAHRTAVPGRAHGAMTFRVALIDDERPACVELRTLLAVHHEIEVVGEASGLTSGAELIARTRPDGVFLDIQLGSASGFGLLPELPLGCHVVFVTAFNEYAVRAFEVNALDYLLKPVHPGRLAATVARLVGHAPAPPCPARLPPDGVAFLSCGSASAFVSVSAIVCVLAEGDYTRVVTADGRERLVLRSLAEWERRLPTEIFLRVHRSAIANLGEVARAAPLRGGQMRLYMSALAEPLLVSRRLARRLKARHR
jgi:two-component system LytT family response regulator